MVRWLLSPRAAWRPAGESCTISNSVCLIQVTRCCYRDQAQGTRGRALQDAAKEIKLLGQVMPVRARIKQLDGFSAHADQAEILRWLRTFKRPPRKTYIVHGEPAASLALAEIIGKQLKWSVAVAN